ncbi:hypothetical protein ACMU_05705 [Actibacterium mucosum KCTC 23349]|uniref:Uncharacterized protein n=1 Tax=Actibacterium mucosum KCTC 23349 TaxID=1454373 RepID=A0A037ZLP4_9RHOB|nr:hypothetical protein [Actibacterium mucosum]KAJ56437.1 hypothetical protein ACMU_05705 [Actibacterium mucosum KCTC 23349]
MSTLSKIFLLATVSLMGLPGQVPAQATNETSEFTPENAILDTSIPLAIGAREARQELRTSFGWPTFQEGLVEGVYFRFDPDGYARFAPTPRLDTDVFEVLCRPRTYSCLGRKDDLSVFLDPSKLLKLEHANVLPGDTFFLVDGISEIQVPERIMQPLDLAMENILSAGNELVIRRGGTEVDRVSLTGFHAVTSYLRWVDARQDYSALPRGWPVPNSAGAEAAILTQTEAWRGPQQQPITGFSPAGTPQTAPVETEVAEVRGELNVLRQLLLEREQPATLQQPSTNPQLTQTEPSLLELEAAAEQLRKQIMQIRGEDAHSVAPIQSASVQSTVPVAPISPPSQAKQMAQRLEYLMTEIGLDARTALMLLDGQGVTPTPVAGAIAAPQEPDVVSQILQELEAEVAIPTIDPASPTPTVPIGRSDTDMMAVNPDEYRLLSEYFKSVMPQ